MSSPFEDPFDDDVELAEYNAAQVAEWSKYEASGVIYHGNAVAATEGMPLPRSSVDKLGWFKNGLARLQADYIEANPDDPDVTEQTQRDVERIKATRERRNAFRVASGLPPLDEPDAEVSGDSDSGEAATTTGPARVPRSADREAKISADADKE